MKRSVPTWVLVGLLCAGLTACGQNRNDSTPNTTPNNSPGIGSDLNQDTNTAPGTQTTPKRTSRAHRSAYDYLSDGRYAASADGRVLPRQEKSRQSLDQSVKNLIRDAEQATKRAADDVGKSVKRAGESAGNAVRDMMQ